jgi:Zn-dependent peptidase ImmA (M78 family)/transcriptional regulator with XRE-family HTH domain
MAKKSNSDSHYAQVTPSVLTWAINRSGKTRDSLAKRLHVKPEDIQRWESGTPVPLKKAEQLADLIYIEFGVLYFSEPPDFRVNLPDQRRVPPRYRHRQSVNFVELVHDAMLRQDWYRDLMIDQEENPLPFVGSFSVSDSVADVAKDIRKVLGIGPAMRDRAKSHASFLNELSRAAEASGVLVMRSGHVKNLNTRRVSPQEVQGFALADPLAPVVFVNSNDFDAPQVFTLVHECVHIWIGKTAVSTPQDGTSNPNPIEAFCNSVAAEVLLPKVEFVSGWKTNRDRDRVQILSSRYFVSGLVVVRRAFDLGLINNAERIKLARRLAKKYQPKPQKRRGKSGPSYFALAEMRAGHRLTDKVLTQVAIGNLIIKDAAALLGMRQSTMSRFASTARAS